MRNACRILGGLASLAETSFECEVLCQSEEAELSPALYLEGQIDKITGATQGFEPGFMQEMFDVSAPSGEVVVDAKHLVAQRQQTVAQMRANEASAAGDQNSL